MNKALALSDGGHLAYKVEGSGPPLLLVSGLGGLGAFWATFAQACSFHYTVITYDHRGTGNSSRCDRPYSIAGMAEDARELCDHLGLTDVLYVGHSTGGAIGQHLATHQLLTLRALVLSATFAAPCRYFWRLFNSRLQLLQHMGLDAYREHASLMLYPPYWLAQQDAPTMAPAPAPHPLDAKITERRIQAILEHNCRQVLNRITCPTLVISANDDIVTPEYHSAELAQAIPNAERVQFDYGGHYLPHTRFPDYYQHVFDFLQTTS